MNLVDQLKRDEGVKLRMYKDQLGIWTIGVGHNLEAHGISQAVAEAILKEDIEAAEHDLVTFLPWTAQLDEPRRAEAPFHESR